MKKQAEERATSYATSIRLSPEAKRLIEALNAKMGLRRGAVIELAVRRLAEAEGSEVVIAVAEQRFQPDAILNLGNGAFIMLTDARAGHVAVALKFLRARNQPQDAEKIHFLAAILPVLETRGVYAGGTGAHVSAASGRPGVGSTVPTVMDKPDQAQPRRGPGRPRKASQLPDAEPERAAVNLRSEVHVGAATKARLRPGRPRKQVAELPQSLAFFANADLADYLDWDEWAQRPNPTAEDDLGYQEGAEALAALQQVLRAAAADAGAGELWETIQERHLPELADLGQRYGASYVARRPLALDRRMTAYSIEADRLAGPPRFNFQLLLWAAWCWLSTEHAYHCAVCGRGLAMEDYSPTRRTCSDACRSILSKRGRAQVDVSGEDTPQ